MSTTTMEQKSGAELIAEERRRQVEREGWTAKHDDEHTDRALAYAAACYAIGGRTVQSIGGAYSLDLWPWSEDDWKPTPSDRIRELVKAGALIAAEIDRLQRVAEPSEDPEPPPVPRVWPENFWREVWHRDCPAGHPDPPMIHHRQYAQIEDGSHLRLYECTRCGVKAWAGLDAGRRVVSRRFEDLTPEPR